MKHIKSVVIAMTIFVTLYTISPLAGLSYDLIFILFVMANLGLVYMVYIILKFGEQPDQKFNEGYWYSDVDRQYGSDRKEE